MTERRLEYARLVCQRVFVTSSDSVDWKDLVALRDTATLEVAMDIVTRRLILNLIASMPAMLAERIQIDEAWPRTWWDAFKERWFPGWLLRRYPVDYVTLHVDKPIYAAVCPHLGTQSNSPHIEWLFEHQEALRHE